MRVLYYTYPMAFQHPGGGETLLLKSRQYLEKLGVTVDLFDQWRTRAADYDLVHCFAWYTASLWPRFKEEGCKVVVTPVSWFEETWGSRLRSRITHGAKRLLYGASATDDAKHYLAPDLFLPNSNGEAVRLAVKFGVSPDRMRIVPHGVDSRFADGDATLFRETHRLQNFVLHVGRFVEQHKNQLGLIRALRGRLNVPMVFIGSPIPGQGEYFEQCRREAAPGTLFLDALPHESPMLASAYKAASVLAMPSFIEAPGLAALEAGIAGAPVVVTTVGATREYFGDHAEYVDPHSADSILRGVNQALARPRNGALASHLLDRFQWDRIAMATREAYEAVL